MSADVVLGLPCDFLDDGLNFELLHLQPLHLFLAVLPLAFAFRS